MFTSVSCCGIIRKRKNNIYDTSGENNHIEKTIHETGTVIDDGVHEILRIYWLVLEQQKEEDILRLLIEKHMIPISSRKSRAFIGQKSYRLLY